MRTNGWISLLWALGLVTPACYADRPIYVAMTPSPGTAGTSGTSGEAGTTGVAGTDGVAGTGVIAPPGCDQMGQIIEQHNCALNGACHDANGAAANFSLAGLPFTDTQGWRRRLVGKYPKGGGALASMCIAPNRPYLDEVNFPATGLLLEKLRRPTPPCGDQMPTLGDKLTASELDCVQRWANVLTLGTTASPVPNVCPIACGPNQYCHFTYVSDGGASGSWACRPRAECAAGVPSCQCLRSVSAECAYCQERADHFRCGGGP